MLSEYQETLINGAIEDLEEALNEAEEENQANISLTIEEAEALRNLLLNILERNTNITTEDTQLKQTAESLQIHNLNQEVKIK